ncbi:MAG: ATP-binding protein [Chloroflexi bacterium]|nr:ATP-binding protein [Chloroflexota bacterium]
MGLFHCPMGAAYYDDDPCIDCGLCTATSREERIEASNKLRAYLRSHAPRQGAIKKIAVAGKGGVGKSTMVTLLANALRAEGYQVLVLDTDESNPGLYRMFGLAQEPEKMMVMLDRFAPDGLGEDGEWLKRDEIGLDDIPQKYILSRDGLKFLMVGKIEDPFQGCACLLANITRELMQKLVMKDKEVVVVDMEAGIESFGRGVERGVDTVLVVVEPSFESMALAEKVTYMAEGMGISRMKAILNKVTSEEIREKMAEELGKKGVKVIGKVYFDSELNAAGFEGRPLTNSRATEDVKAIIKALLSEAV